MRVLFRLLAGLHSLCNGYLDGVKAQNLPIVMPLQVGLHPLVAAGAGCDSSIVHRIAQDTGQQ